MYINLLPDSTPSYQETERRHPPFPSNQRHPRRHKVRMYGRACTPDKEGLVDLPAKALPMITDFST